MTPAMVLGYLPRQPGAFGVCSLEYNRNSTSAERIRSSWSWGDVGGRPRNRCSFTGMGKRFSRSP